jgi:Ca2+-binding EF-hand superfamily protein
MKTKLFLTAAAVSLAGVLITSTAAAEPKGDKPRRELPPEVMARFDQDGDGKLNKEERAALRAEMEARRGERGERRGPPRDRMREHLEQFDADGDGRLNETERAALDASLRERAANNPRAMGRIDTNGDGSISDAEWAVAREEMKQRMRGGLRGPGGPGGPEGKRGAER